MRSRGMPNLFSVDYSGNSFIRGLSLSLVIGDLNRDDINDVAVLGFRINDHIDTYPIYFR